MSASLHNRRTHPTNHRIIAPRKLFPTPSHTSGHICAKRTPVGLKDDHQPTQLPTMQQQHKEKRHHQQRNNPLALHHMRTLLYPQHPNTQQKRRYHDLVHPMGHRHPTTVTDCSYTTRFSENTATPLPLVLVDHPHTHHRYFPYLRPGLPGRDLPKVWLPPYRCQQNPRHQLDLGQT